MQLQLTRKVFSDQSTIGELSVNGAFECFTLEDKVRPVKIKGDTAIPAGTYEVAVTFSNKFQKFLPCSWMYRTLTASAFIPATPLRTPSAAS
jgi:hypothetical protein